MNSSMLKGYLTGLILGDGSIDQGVTKRAFNIKSTNFDFIDEIEKTLKQHTPFTIQIKEVEGSVKNGVTRKPYKEIRTKTHPYFNKKYSFFYDDYRNRRITKEVLNWLNPIGWANWFMSDGYITHVGKTKGIIKSRRIELCLDRYSYNDVCKVKQHLENKYGYTISIIPRGKVFRIRFNYATGQHFLIMIEPYVVPSMRYKLNMKYDYQPKWMCDEYYNLMCEIEQREHPTR